MIIAFDNETFLITRERPFPTVVCTSWRRDDGLGEVMPHNGQTLEHFTRWLADPDYRFVGHFTAFDFGTLAASYPRLLPAIFEAYKTGRVTDTQIRQQLIDIASGRTLAEDVVNTYSLDKLFELIFDRQMPTGGKKQSITEDKPSIRLRYAELYDVDFAEWPDEAIEYSQGDSDATLAVYQAQDEHAGALLRDDPFQSYSSFCLTLISAQGMRTAPERVAKLKAEQLEVMSTIEPELVAAGLLESKTKGRGKNKVHVGYTKKTKPAQERVARACAELGIDPIMTKPHNPQAKPQIAIDRKACYWCRDPLMLRRAEYVTAEKMLSTYIPFLEAGADGPVTSRFNLAATGRTTSSTPRPPALGGNMQNAPRKTKRVGADGELEDSPNGVRECFAPRPGNVYLSADFAGAELHALAQVCYWKFGYSILGRALKNGLDPHLFVACYLLNGNDRDYPEIVELYNANDKTVIQARHESKAANFGFAGGMGIVGFMRAQLREGKIWERDAASRLREAWFSAWPEMTDYFAANKTELGPRSSAVVEFYWSKRLRKVKAFTVLSNGWFQALVADGAKKAINEVVRLCFVGGESSALYRNGTRPVNFIHDELVVETRDGSPEQLAPVVDEFVATLQDEFNELLPDFPTTVDPVLAYMQSKRAKTVRDENERLVPWRE